MRRHGDGMWRPPSPAAAVPPGVRAASAQPRYTAPCRHHTPRAPAAAAPFGGAAAPCCTASGSACGPASRARRRCHHTAPLPLAYGGSANMPGARHTALRRPVPRYARTAHERAMRAPQLSQRVGGGGEGWGGRGGHTAAATCKAAGTHRHADAAPSAESATRAAHAVRAGCSLHARRARAPTLWPAACGSKEEAATQSIVSGLVRNGSVQLPRSGTSGGGGGARGGADDDHRGGNAVQTEAVVAAVSAVVGAEGVGGSCCAPRRTRANAATRARSPCSARICRAAVQRARTAGLTRAAARPGGARATCEARHRVSSARNRGAVERFE